VAGVDLPGAGGVAGEFDGGGRHVGSPWLVGCLGVSGSLL
jgi:hypothetical protein